MPIVIEGTYKITIRWQMPQAVEAQSVYTYKCTVAGAADMADMLDAFVTQQGTAYAEIEDLVSDEVGAFSAEIAHWDTVEEEWNTEATTAVSNMTGQSVADMAPHGNAPVVRFTTAVGRRQGRKFIPGFIETAYAESVLSAGAQTALLAWGLLADNSLSDSGTTLVCGVWNPTDGFKGFSQDVLVNTISGYQRRRKPGVGI